MSSRCGLAGIWARPTMSSTDQGQTPDGGHGRFPGISSLWTGGRGLGLLLSGQRNGGDPCHRNGLNCSGLAYCRMDPWLPSVEPVFFLTRARAVRLGLSPRALTNRGIDDGPAGETHVTGGVVHPFSCLIGSDVISGTSTKLVSKSTN